MDQFFPHCLTLASCWFWDSCYFSATLPLFPISRQLLMIFVHTLCYFAPFYSCFSCAHCTIFNCASSFLNLPIPLHLPFSLALSSSARPGLPRVETILMHSQGLHPLQCTWECRDLGEPKEFLCMHITRKGHAIHLNQCVYLQKAVKRCGMLNVKAASTPLPAGYYALVNKDPVNPELCSRFQMVIGSLLYLMLGTRPNIAFAVTHLSWHSTNPSQDHLNKALYICWYLIGMSSYFLVYIGGSSFGFMACTDSNRGSDLTSCLSQTGFYLKLAEGLISWTSCVQKIIVYSSTEAEYMALSDCACQVIWIWSLLGELSYKLRAIPICGDNQGSIFVTSNPIMEPYSKHIDICCAVWSEWRYGLKITNNQHQSDCDNVRHGPLKLQWVQWTALLQWGCLVS